MDVYPTASEVVGLLGRTGDPAATAAAERAVPMVAAMVRGWTRGRGFDDRGEPAFADLAAVIVSAAARLVANPSQLEQETVMGPFRHDVRGGFDGFTTHEQVILNRYRQRAA